MKPVSRRALAALAWEGLTMTKAQKTANLANLQKAHVAKASSDRVKAQSRINGRLGGRPPKTEAGKLIAEARRLRIRLEREEAAKEVQIPKVEAVLYDGPHNRYWLVEGCPYCNKRHRHFAGSALDSPEKFLGARRTGCSTSRNAREYVVTWDQRATTKEFPPKVRKLPPAPDFD